MEIAPNKLWLAFGFIAQGCFFMRFLVQWMESERRKESVIPISFWYWSLLGAGGTMIYAVHRRDPVFVLGQTTGFVIYIRNLIMIGRKEKAPGKDLASAHPEGPQ
jgi:lipid-A-disaccharide synthase-like uncharacterized protein